MYFFDFLVPIWFAVNLIDGIMCLVKTLLEQGGPFTGPICKSNDFSFLMCCTLLGGLVLSNAFKSEIVYNIVLPRERLPLRTMGEFLQHGYKLYTKLARVNSAIFDLSKTKLLFPLNKSIEWHSLKVSTYENDYIYYATTEVDFYEQKFRSYYELM